MLSIGGKVHISLSIVHIKTYYNLADRRTQFAKIDIASKNIVTNWSTSYTCNDPLAGVYPLPVNGKVHVVNFWITVVGRVGIRSKMDDITDGFPIRANPCAPRFNRCGRERVCNLKKESDADDSENKYEQDCTGY